MPPELAIVEPSAPDVPRVYVAPPLGVAHEYATITAVRSAILAHDAGEIESGALLWERMLWNARVFSVVQTRVNGLLATEVRWEAARQNRDGRRALDAWREDYPNMAPSAVRQHRARWALGLGVSAAQREGRVSQSTGRTLYYVRPYWPGWLSWDDARAGYSVQTDYKGGIRNTQIDIASPAMGGIVDPTRSPWMIYEPFGPYSWRFGLLHPFFYSWFGLDRAERDAYRASEKHGVGILKIFHDPVKGTEGQNAIARLAGRTRTMGSEGTIALENAAADDGKGQNVEPLEFNGQGFAAIESARNGAAVNLAVAGLGHNLTTEVKGGSFAAASVGDYIRGDLKEGDAGAEVAHDRDQLGRPWALANFGDPDLAPIPRPNTDPPAKDQAAATTLQLLGQFIQAAPPDVDKRALLDRFRVPLSAVGTTQVQAPAMPSGDAQPIDAPTQSSDAPTQISAEAKQVNVIGNLTLTPTDQATIVRVDEGRRDIGLEPIGGETGGKWIAQHSAEIRAAAAPEIATAAQAEQGTDPTAEPEPAPMPEPAPEAPDESDDESTPDEPTDQ